MNTATRKKEGKTAVSDKVFLLPQFCDSKQGVLVWSDGSVTMYRPNSAVGVVMSAQLAAAKKRPMSAVTVKGVSVTREWGWVNGRWTVKAFK